MNIPRYLDYVSGSIQSRGVAATLRCVASDLWFDVSHGVETIGMAALHELHDIPGPARVSGNRYQGANPLLFRRLFKELSAAWSYDFGNECFFDFGCGKGRALLMALELGFREVAGVEWSRKLCGICTANIGRFRRHHPSCGDATVICGDAGQTRIPDTATVLFYFNPFKARVFDDVSRRICESLERRPRRITHVYLNPVNPLAFARPGVRKLFSWYAPGGHHEEAVVYVEGAEPRRQPSAVHMALHGPGRGK
jgi:SAM-dependent methyltransferase